MKVLVFGSRAWTDVELITNRLTRLPQDTVLIHGAACGADTIAGVIGEALGFTVMSYPADWETHGKQAGPIRNQLMLAENTDVTLALGFIVGDDSRGSEDMLRRINNAGITADVVRVPKCKTSLR